MEPTIHLNYLSVTIATVAFFFLGFLWYTPLFGKVWAKEMGFDSETTKDIGTSFLVRSLLLNLLGNFLMVYVLAHNIGAWDPRSWGHETHFVAPAVSATMSACFTWLGFYLPQDLGVVTWQMKSWKLFFINTSYHFVSLLLVAFILVFI